ncbi:MULTISPECIES: mannose-6-phosphate isomerase, class I [unclassified Streptococcus]|uniref:mannose-6-phosphate isomerase, class I n=1 Tax=unclassified Streptococcus TaxID=2608887 RepID=UPI001072208D|nr:MULTISPECIES: mannose-6-phosphate isomerase, class I [unclassified Streptococcus]MBF0806262.1 mannose-6-phosphate isomerase, class I [Streptococcus sp. 19428wA2_WM07]TFU28142.1 mannose-6-phosphate isomerase, class I [Streptococcus sp. WM07]
MGQPLFLQAVIQEKIWGGRKLEEVFGYPLKDGKFGEAWAISAHPNGVSTILNGPFQGMGLDQLYREQPALFGNRSEPVFPLLTKILDANDWLSVQVHPDDAYGLEHEGELGKTECWYVLDAEPGAEIIYGHQAQSKEELAQMLAEGCWDDLLLRQPVQKGDFFYVPSGTMHAIGKGILILETQQSSDTTYRVYDFDRQDEQGQTRELHLQQSLDVLNLGPVANSRTAALKVGSNRYKQLVANDFFVVWKWEIRELAELSREADYLLVSVIEGRGNMTVGEQDYPLKKGDHFLLLQDVDSWSFSGEMELIVSHP